MRGSRSPRPALVPCRSSVPSARGVATSRLPSGLPAGACDGFVDDTAALRAAIAALPSGGRLALPTHGRCRFTDRITVDKPIIIQGGGWVPYHSQTEIFGTQLHC